MKSQLLAVAFAGALSSVALSTGAFAETKLESDKDKLSYSLGMIFGDHAAQNFGDIDYDILMEALKAQKEGSETLLSVGEAQNVLREQQAKAAEAQAAAAKAVGEKFLADNAARDGVTVTESGLQYEVVTAAEGAKPSVDDTVSVHYTGTLIDGTVFDSSVERGEPASFPLTSVIPGWTEGVQLMNVGSKYRFVIPSDLAYGDRGAGQSIGPGETLVFEVELLEIMAK